MRRNSTAELELSVEELLDRRFEARSHEHRLAELGTKYDNGGIPPGVPAPAAPGRREEPVRPEAGR
ncbi:MAG TPA: hypothetical protein VFG80_00430, partial [Myxococcota bacterium]|nr:hypothetical protein [Myxococcota bacterium]